MAKTIDILSVRLDGFGCLKDPKRTIEFRPGALNVVTGPNESGKSTLLRAIISLIFGIYDPAERKAAQPWDGRAKFGGELILQAGDKRFRFQHDFDKCNACIERLNGKGKAVKTIFSDNIGKTYKRGEAQAYRDAVSGILGAATPEFLLNSHFLRQAQMDVQIDAEVRRVTAGMQRGSLERIVERLTERYTELTHYNKFTRRPLRERRIETLDHSIKTMRARLEEIRANSLKQDSLAEQMTQVEDGLERSTAALDQARRRFQTLEKLYALSQQREKTTEQLSQLRGQERERVEREEEVKRLRERLEERFPALLNAPEDLEARLEELDRRQRQFESLSGQSRLAEETRKENQEKLEEVRRQIATRFIRFVDQPEDFIARLERFQQLRSELETADQRSQELREERDEAQAKIDGFGPLAQLPENFSEQWHRAREIRQESLHIEEDFRRFEENRRRQTQHQQILTYAVFLIGTAFAVLLLLIFGLSMTGIVSLICVLLACFGATYFLRPTGDAQKEIQHSELEARKERMNNELEAIEEEWDVEGVDLQSKAVLEAFVELRGLREKTARLNEKIEELDGKDSEGGRRRELQEQIEAYDEVYNDFESRPIDDVRLDWREFRRLQDEQRRLQTLIDEKDESLSITVAELDEAIRAELEEVSAFIGEEGDAAETLRRLREFREIRTRAEILQTQLERGKKLDDLRREAGKQELEYNRVGNAMDDLLKEKPNLRPLADHPAQLSDKMTEQREKAESLESRIAELRDAYFELKSEAASIPRAPGDDMESLQERIEDQTEELQRLRRVCQALEIALENLQECERDFQRLHLKQLGQRSGEYFSAITAGRYSELNFDDAYRPLAKGRAAAAVDPDALSQGARDQLFLAVRFALARELAGEARWPFLLDDPFVNCDEERLNAIRETLRELAGRHQTLLLTHDLQYNGWGHVVQMERLAS
ncbi:AAA family ATPase [Candidatus Sumerlaeota bacterium]|nr:AAA family ATPase [Candidatus Sumerlaeota bacterium]